MNNSEEKIPLEEGYLIEFKSYSGGVSPKELAMTMTAFANTEGGAIYLGVTDRRLIQGVTVTPVLLDHIQNAAREGCSPPVPISLQQIPVHRTKAVLKISVEKSGHLHSVASGQTYIRVGTQDKRVLGEELLRLAETKSEVSFEERLLDVGLETLDPEALNEYVTARRAVTSMRGDLHLEDFLIKIGLAKKDGGTFKIRVGAYILFGKARDDVLLQRDFTFVKYEADGRMYTFREDVALPAARLLDRLMELIRPYNNVTEGVRGLRRQERYVYPETAIREALLNAFAHRDYRIAGLHNECRWYPDRLEIISAGGLPSMITLENMDRRHYSRNPKIMHALLTMRLTEELGQGVRLMRQALQKNNNPPPEFEASQDQVKVVFRRPRGSIAKPAVRQILDHYFAANPHIARRQIEALCGVGGTSAKKLIQDLLREGYLEKIGQGPGTRYVKRG